MTPEALIATKDEIVKAAREATEMSREVWRLARCGKRRQHLADVLCEYCPYRRSLTKHHNALTCPYCNPKGLKLQESAPAGHETSPQKEPK